MMSIGIPVFKSDDTTSVVKVKRSLVSSEVEKYAVGLVTKVLQNTTKEVEAAKILKKVGATTSPLSCRSHNY